MRLGKGFYVYRFLDKNDKVIYVGRAQNLEQRLVSHLSGVSNIKLGIKDTERIEYTSLNTLIESEILETYLIAIWNPKLNKMGKINEKISDSIQLELKNDFEWKVYTINRSVDTYNILYGYAFHDEELDLEIKLEGGGTELKDKVYVIRSHREKHYYINTEWKNGEETIIIGDRLEEAEIFEELGDAVNILKELDSDYSIEGYFKRSPCENFRIHWEYYAYKYKFREDQKRQKIKE